jgi:Cu-Zn family superoxide dismutase
MSPRVSLPLLAGATLLASCTTTGGTRTSPLATAPLLSATGQPMGEARLVAAGNGIALHVMAMGLPAGQHGLHLHAVGRCAPPDFASAGPHLNPQAKMHGMDNPQGAHLGDLPNLTVAATGKGELTATLMGSRAELEPLLFDADGTAIVIHAGQDDYRTDPSGNSGGRIACGAFMRG